MLLTTRECQRGLVEAITDLGEQSHPLEQLVHAACARLVTGNQAMLTQRQRDVVINGQREGSLPSPMRRKCDRYE